MCIRDRTSTECDITGLSTSAQRFQLWVQEWSWTGDTNQGIRLGDAGGVENNAYVSTGWKGGNGYDGGTSTSEIWSQSLADNTYKMNWVIDFIYHGSNKWFIWGMAQNGTGPSPDDKVYGMTGTKTLSDTLTTIRLFGGTFDSGSYRLLTWT